MEGYFIGIDWGGTRIKIGAARADGEFLHREFLKVSPVAEFKSQVDDVIAVVRRCIHSLPGRPLGVALALTGAVNPEQGVVLLPGKIKDMEGYPLVPQFRQLLDLPVWAVNDGMAAMYAEKKFGRARDKKWAVTLTIGTGVGSGVMLDGRILHDPHFMFSSQLGHIIIDGSQDQLCLTGVRGGTGEMLCSATALALGVRSGLQRGIPSSLSDCYWKNPHAVDFKKIMEDGVAKADRLCVDELARWTRKLSWLLINAIHAFSPQIVILGGGATAAADAFLPELRREVQSHIFRYPPGETVPIEISELGDRAGILGAIAMVIEKMEFLPSKN
jgi:glucokinase